MFHRLGPRRSTERMLRYGVLVAIVIVAASATTLALRREADTRPSQISAAGSCKDESPPQVDGSCRDDAAEKTRSIQGASLGRAGKMGVSTVAAPVDIPTTKPSEATEASAALPPGALEHGSASPPAPQRATPSAQSAGTKVRTVSPRARAEAPRRAQPAETRSTLGLGLAPRERSYTGADRSFDAVH
jgi:hypothetical protein